MVRLLLYPKDAVVMRLGCKHVRQAVVVDVHDVDEPEVAQLPVGMELPVAAARIGRSFEPTVGCQDVVAAVAIHVAYTDSMAVAAIADNVLDDAALVVAFIPGEGRLVVAELRQDLVGLAVVVQVNQKGELDGIPGLNLMLFPGSG